MATEAKFGSAKPGSLPTIVSKRQRQRMFDLFMDATKANSGSRILDVGVTSDRTHDHSNYFEALYAHKSSVTAVGIEDASFLEHLYPGLRYVRADGCSLPFEDASFDFVHSGAVIEHTGSRRNQSHFLKELWRVARRSIFVTTPNRWFPIEVHTVLPLIHYLPPAVFRRILLTLGHAFFAAEDNLNLMSRGNLLVAARQAGIRNAKVIPISLLGITSNLVLYADKERADFRHAQMLESKLNVQHDKPDEAKWVDKVGY
jgi:hypothetical protein